MNRRVIDRMVRASFVYGGRAVLFLFVPKGGVIDPRTFRELKMETKNIDVHRRPDGSTVFELLIITEYARMQRGRLHRSNRYSTCARATTRWIRRAIETTPGTRIYPRSWWQE